MRECDTCHTTTQFRIRPFDHEGVTGYPLDGRHARVRCAECHRRVELRNGVHAVRYRLGYRQCSDCHANPHTGSGGGGGEDGGTGSRPGGDR